MGSRVRAPARSPTFPTIVASIKKIVLGRFPRPMQRDDTPHYEHHFLAIAVHCAARADHHVEAARHSGEGASASGVATAWDREATAFFQGDLPLRRIVTAS